MKTIKNPVVRNDQTNWDNQDAIVVNDHFSPILLEEGNWVKVMTRTTKNLFLDFHMVVKGKSNASKEFTDYYTVYQVPYLSQNEIDQIVKEH